MNQSQIRMGFCSIFTLNVVVMCLLRNRSCLFSFLSLLPDRCILTGLNQYRGSYNPESLSRVLLENAQDSAPSSKYVGMVFWGFICIAGQSCKIRDWYYPLWLDKGNRFCGLRGRLWSLTKMFDHTLIMIEKNERIREEHQLRLKEIAEESTKITADRQKQVRLFVLWIICIICIIRIHLFISKKLWWSHILWRLIVIHILRQCIYQGNCLFLRNVVILLIKSTSACMHQSAKLNIITRKEGQNVPLKT